MERNDFPQIITIKQVIPENPYTNTYVFKHTLGSKPGQFINLWIPGVDENPMSIAWDDGKAFACTIAKVGDMTEELFKLKKGDKVGVRGPYGTFYNIKPKKTIATVAGGYGAAPMYNAAMAALKEGCKVEFIVGARSKDLLIYVDRVKKIKNLKLHVATDDGSMGHKGYNVEILRELLLEKKIDQIFACGPELMLKAVVDFGFQYKIDTQLSMERYMKCGIGVCGNCVMDDLGIPICKQGPVMAKELVAKLPEFGQYHRDSVGKKQFY